MKFMQIEHEQKANPVEIWIVYDNVPAGKGAKELCDRLQQQLGTDYELRVNPWNVAALEIPALARASILSANLPDLLIVAMDGQATLPPRVRSWISHCLRKTRATGSAIAVQFHDVLRMGKELAPAYDELKRIALEVQGDFFSEVAEPPDGELDRRLGEIHRCARMTTAVLAAIPVAGSI
jgi:hypothetical protein